MIWLQAPRFPPSCNTSNMTSSWSCHEMVKKAGTLKKFSLGTFILMDGSICKSSPISSQSPDVITGVWICTKPLSLKKERIAVVALPWTLSTDPKIFVLCLRWGNCFRNPRGCFSLYLIGNAFTSQFPVTCFFCLLFHILLLYRLLPAIPGFPPNFQKPVLCQSLNLQQLEGFPKITHHLHIETRLCSGTWLNKSMHYHATRRLRQRMHTCIYHYFSIYSYLLKSLLMYASWHISHVLFPSLVWLHYFLVLDFLLCFVHHGLKNKNNTPTP